jgi:hypothetical protein
MSLKRKFSLASNSTTTTTTAAIKKENDGGSTINFHIMSASQSPDEQLSVTPTMELDLISNASVLMPAPAAGQNDEPPYFPEKFTGKLCAFCNLGGYLTYDNSYIYILN